MRVPHVSFLVLTATLLVAPSVTEAAIRPSFSWEASSWEATHIVVADEGKVIDGHFTVVQSWLGDLEPGAKIKLPELGEFLRSPFRGFLDQSEPKVTGRRTILFLRQDRDAQSTGDAWYPTGAFHEMLASVAWVEANKVFARKQLSNPGTPVITSLHMSEATLKAHVDGMLRLKAELGAIQDLEDPISRARSALAHINADPVASSQVYAILVSCGDVVVPELLMLSEEPKHSWAAFDALGKIGSERAVTPLVKVLEDSLVFWTGAAARLKEGWWNGTDLSPEASRLHRAEYLRVTGALRALTAIGKPGFQDVVTRTRALWLKHKPLHSIGGGQMVEECDAALAALKGD